MSLKQSLVLIIVWLLPLGTCAQNEPVAGREYRELLRLRRASKQAPVAKPLTEEQRKAQAELAKKAIALLEELISEAASLRLIENRVHVLTTAAELLWKRDETRARALLREAMNQFYDLETPAAPTNPRSYQLWEARAGLRQQLLQLLAAREPKLALEFLRATRPAAPKSALDELSAYDFEQQFERQLALRLAENDPQEALRLARETLSREVDPQVVEIWSSLQKKDPAAANQLVAEIVAKLKTSDWNNSYATPAVAYSLLPQLRAVIREAQQAATSEAGAKNAPLSTSATLPELQQTYRELLEVVVAATLKVTAASLIDVQEGGRARQLLTMTQGLLPEIEKYLPQRATAVRAKLNQFDKAFYHQPVPEVTLEAMEQRSAAELMELAAKSQPGLKELLYHQAAMKAIEQGDLERARQIAKDNLKAGAEDPIYMAIRGAELERAAEQGRFEEARQTLAQLSSDNERALALLEMAKQAAAKNDQKVQKELLAEARELVGGKLDTRQQVAMQLALAAGYLDLEPKQSFATLESAIEKLNAVVAAMVLLDSFDEGGRFKDGEMRMAAADFSQGFMDGFDQLLAEFARKDFESTKAALRRWQINEVRLTMCLMLAEHFLSESKEALRPLRPRNIHD